MRVYEFKSFDGVEKYQIHWVDEAELKIAQVSTRSPGVTRDGASQGKGNNGKRVQESTTEHGWLIGDEMIQRS